MCTDNSSDIDFWNGVDDEEEFSLDVIDDMEGEAKEIKQNGNGFLVYTPLLHRLREAGTRCREMDLLDEQR